MKGEVGANGRLVKQVFTEKFVGTMPRGRLNLFSQLSVFYFLYFLCIFCVFSVYFLCIRPIMS